MQYDLIIIGGGPAGSAAAVYAARKRLKALIIAKEFGGQSVVSPDIQNWIGTISISGETLAKNLKAHIEAYKDEYVDIKEGEFVLNITKDGDRFSVTTDNGSYSAKALLIASGSDHRKLEIPGAEQYEHKGITYCASCDGPLFSDLDVVVVGGGNAAFETAAQLLAYCKSVTLIHRSEYFRAEAITVEKILSHPNMRIIKNAELLEARGGAMVDTIVYRDKTSGEVKELPTGGIFVEIGQVPNVSFARELVEMTEYGNIQIDPWTQKTTTPGIWAAGDCTNVLYHQNNIAVGDAVRAIENIYQTLHGGK